MWPLEAASFCFSLWGAVARHRFLSLVFVFSPRAPGRPAAKERCQKKESDVEPPHPKGPGPIQKKIGAKSIRCPAVRLWGKAGLRRADEDTHGPAKNHPCLWFDHQAEAAAGFYVSLFPDSAVTSVTSGPDGRALVVEFKLAGVEFLALNGGPHFKFNEAISLSIDCYSQAEVDEYWERLSAGGSGGQCGWLKDKYGVSWQVVPSVLPKLLTDPATAAKVFRAMLQMTKLDVATLQAAAVW